VSFTIDGTPQAPVPLQVSGQPPSGLGDTLGRLIDGRHDGRSGRDAIVVLQRSGPTIRTFVRGPLSVVGRSLMIN
jgi:hypothetical protein